MIVPEALHTEVIILKGYQAFQCIQDSPSFFFTAVIYKTQYQLSKEKQEEDFAASLCF